MKIKTLLLIPGMVGMACAAPISIGSGVTTYTQDFDSLPNTVNNAAASGAWSDDSTLPGWYIYRAGVAATPLGFAGAGFATWYVSDGTAPAKTAPLAAGVYSLGAAASTDRSLGSSSTTAQAEISTIALFQNTAANPVKLTNVKFSAEVYRYNSAAANTESLYCWYRTAPTVAAANTITTAAISATVFPPAQSTGPTAGLYISGWTQANEFRYTLPGGSTGAATPVVTQAYNAAPTAAIIIQPGEVLAMRWSTINDAGDDGMMGIDDLELTFTELTCAISATATNITREPGVLLTDPSDDTISFDLTVTPTGISSPSGWIVNGASPVGAGATGPYGAASHLTRPVSEFVSGNGNGQVLLEDASDANCTITATVPAPKFIAPVTAAFSPAITFTAAAAGANSYVNPINAFNEIGWSSTTATSLVEAQPAPNTGGNKYFKHTAAAATMSSDPVSLSELGGQGVELEVGVGLYTTSNSGMEDTDVIAVNLEVALDGNFTNSAGGNLIKEAVTGIDAVIPPLGAAYGASIAIGTPYIGFNTVAYPATDFTFHRFRKSIPVPPASASTALARLTFVSTTGITTEHMLLDDVVFRAVSADTLTISAPAGITRNANGSGVEDDTVSFTLDIGGAGISAQWDATGAVTASGAYGAALPFTVPAGAAVRSAVIIFTDSINAALTRPVTVNFDPVYLIGTVDVGAGEQELLTPALDAAGQKWTNTPATRLTRLNNAGTTTAKAVASQPVDLTGVTGAVVSLTLSLEDHSNGFETGDMFELKLILNGDTGNPVNLITQNEAGDHDTDDDGALSGGELVPAGTYTAAAPFSRELNFRYSIPAGTTSAVLEFSATNESTNEFLTVKDLRFGIFADADLDGMSDAYEDANGLDKNSNTDKDTDLDGDGRSNYLEYVAGTVANDPASALSITDASISATNEISLTWTTVPGKRYRAMVSPDLGSPAAWAPLGAAVTATATTTSLPPGNILPVGVSPRYFLRIEVVP